MSKHEFVIRADWDDEAQVWVASSDDFRGLAIEADTLDALRVKLKAALSDLAELNGPPSSNGGGPCVELIAHSHLNYAAA